MENKLADVVNFDGVNLACANNAIRRIGRLLKQYPLVRKQMGFLGTLRSADTGKIPAMNVAILKMVRI